MGDIFNSDFLDFIKALNKAKVEYMLVGGYSVILHGYARTTGDMDIWIKPDAENYIKLNKAFLIFKMPVFDMTLEKFLDVKNYDVFTFGRPPFAIEILTAVKGLDFDKTYTNSIIFIENKTKIRTINYTHLILAKKAAGRSRDLNDIENLQKGNS